MAVPVCRRAVARNASPRLKARFEREYGSATDPVAGYFAVGMRITPQS
ncbi:Uncharacterised protein [Vibrio cholerae]|nr:Uncharacterised protein [Vibrio cholerae]